MLILEFMVDDSMLFIPLIIIHLYHLNHALMTFLYKIIKEKNQLKKYEKFIVMR